MKFERAEKYSIRSKFQGGVPTIAAWYFEIMNELLTIAGTAGGLEARLAGPQADGASLSRLAILCHPHPLYGGSMDDMVLGILAGALQSADIACLRFNFRGVGGSGGTHDGNGGEIEDLDAVIGWASETHPDARLTLGGYSFGASTICRLLDEHDQPEQLERVLLVAPPVGNLPAPEPDGRVRTDVFAGDADPFVDHRALAGWRHAEVHLLSGADHFFGGHAQALTEQITGVLDN